jgi:hypothetical protein
VHDQVIDIHEWMSTHGEGMSTNAAAQKLAGELGISKEAARKRIARA